jgi:hypothetical protein
VPRQFQARYRLTLDDYAVLSRACTRLTKGRRTGRMMRTAINVLFFIGAAVAANYGDWATAAYLAALGLIFAALWVLLEPWQRRRQFKEQRAGDLEIAFRADDSGFSTQSEQGEGVLKRGAVRHVDDLPDHVILWPNTRIGWIVPRRGFATREEAATFADFAKEKTVGSKL